MTGVPAREEGGPSWGRLGAVIAAAGCSSRMGAFKPLLPLGGICALDRAIDLFLAAGIADITVVVGHRANDLLPVLARRPVRAVVNASYLSGMYSSVVAGLAALPPNLAGCFFLPVDVPLVRPHTVARLAERSNTGGAEVLYPTFLGRRGHPPFLSRRLFPEILAGDGAGGLEAVLRRHEARAAEVAVFDEAILLDMDTPRDYGLLRARARAPGIPSRAECLAMLAARPVPEAVLRHCEAVAWVAGFLADALAGRGVAMDPDLVRAGALLHDLAKGEANHAARGAWMVERQGFPRVAPVIASHSDLVFVGSVPDERDVVYLADKLVSGDRVVTLEERLRRTEARLAGDAAALRGMVRRHDTARRIAAAIETRLGATLSDVLEIGADLAAQWAVPAGSWPILEPPRQERKNDDGAFFSIPSLHAIAG